MHLINVDLPLPDGPQITIRSPLATDKDISRRTWKDPNHLFRPQISIKAFWRNSAAFPLFMMTIHLNLLFPNDVLTTSSNGT